MLLRISVQRGRKQRNTDVCIIRVANRRQRLSTIAGISPGAIGRACFYQGLPGTPLPSSRRTLGCNREAASAPVECREKRLERWSRLFEIAQGSTVLEALEFSPWNGLRVSTFGRVLHRLFHRHVRRQIRTAMPKIRSSRSNTVVVT